MPNMLLKQVKAYPISDRICLLQDYKHWDNLPVNWRVTRLSEPKQLSLCTHYTREYGYCVCKILDIILRISDPSYSGFNVQIGLTSVKQ